MPDPNQVTQGALAVQEIAKSVGGDLVAAFGTAKAAKGAQRLFGPAVDEVAEAMRRWTAYRVGNLEKVVAVAEKKARGQKHGSIAPRVAIRMLADASTSDDPVVVEYVSGVLASSRSTDGSDDRGVSWLSMIAGMSSPQLRLHYVLYQAVRHALIFRGSPPCSNVNDLVRYDVFIPTGTLSKAMEWEGDDRHVETSFLDTFLGLRRNDLVGDNFAWGEESYIRSWPTPVDFPVPAEGGLMFAPTFAGVGLFMWGVGRGREHYDAFTSDNKEMNFSYADFPLPMDGVRAGRSHRP